MNTLFQRKLRNEKQEESERSISLKTANLDRFDIYSFGLVPGSRGYREIFKDSAVD